MIERLRSRRLWIALATGVVAGVAAIALVALPAGAAKTDPYQETAVLWGQGEGLTFQDIAGCEGPAQGMRITHEVWQTVGNLVAHGRNTTEVYNEDENEDFGNICDGTTYHGTQVFSDDGVAFQPGPATDSQFVCFGPVDTSKPDGSRVTCTEGGGGLTFVKIVKAR